MQAHWTASLMVVDSQSNIACGGRGGSGRGMISVATPGLDNVLSSLTGNNANSNGGSIDGGEYIVEAFLEHTDKIEVLIQTLLAIEFWREHVLFIPRGGGTTNDRRNDNRNDDNVIEEEEEEVEFEIEGGERRGDEGVEEYNDLNDVDGGEEEHNNDNAAISSNNSSSSSSSENNNNKGLAYRLASNGNALRTAFILHAETTIVSLLNLIFYKGIPAELLEGGGSGDDALLSLVDYCARQLVSFFLSRYLHSITYIYLGIAYCLCFVELRSWFMHNFMPFACFSHMN